MESNAADILRLGPVIDEMEAAFGDDIAAIKKAVAAGCIPLKTLPLHRDDGLAVVSYRVCHAFLPSPHHQDPQSQAAR